MTKCQVDSSQIVWEWNRMDLLAVFWQPIPPQHWSWPQTQCHSPKDLLALTPSHPRGLFVHYFHHHTGVVSKLLFWLNPFFTGAVFDCGPCCLVLTGWAPFTPWSWFCPPQLFSGVLQILLVLHSESPSSLELVSYQMSWSCHLLVFVQPTYNGISDLRGQTKGWIYMIFLSVSMCWVIYKKVVVVIINFASFGWD